MEIRNVAIIAHVDHGKTTLVDALLKQSSGFKLRSGAPGDLIMDTNELERERGITIFSKNAAVRWKRYFTPAPSPKGRGEKNNAPLSLGEGGSPTIDGQRGEVKINIIDTPGHADFGGEVERVLKMADGALLLVDAKEGPMPQSRFVLKKALALGLKIIVVINKIDKPDARPAYAAEKTLELFLELGVPDKLANFPAIYASGKLGLAGPSPDLSQMKDVAPLFETIVREIRPPTGDLHGPLQILVTMIAGDQFKGRIAIGRVYRGVVQAGQAVILIKRDGCQENHHLTSLMNFEGLERVEVSEAAAGDIVALAGLPDVMIGETVADPLQSEALPLLAVEEPTVKMTFLVNDSPFAAEEGRFTTSRQLRERLYRELENDMALRVEDLAASPTQSFLPAGGWIVSGRGELHLAILIERLRREGYEFQVSRPQVIVREINGQILVPFEKVFLDLPEQYAGVAIEKLSARHGSLQDYKMERGAAYLEFLIPTRGLFGYRSEFLTDTKGVGVMNASFYQYQEDTQVWKEGAHGSMVASESGETLLYGLVNVQNQGALFYGPGARVYKGQVVGQHSRAGDLRVNVCKAKQLSNVRARGDGGAEHFNTPRPMDLEDALEYIGDDELVEVTPKSVRIRKIILDEAAARRRARGIK